MHGHSARNVLLGSQIEIRCGEIQATLLHVVIVTIETVLLQKTRDGGRLPCESRGDGNEHTVNRRRQCGQLDTNV